MKRNSYLSVDLLLLTPFLATILPVLFYLRETVGDTWGAFCLLAMSCLLAPVCLCLWTSDNSDDDFDVDVPGLIGHLIADQPVFDTLISIDWAYQVRRLHDPHANGECNGPVSLVASPSGEHAS
jgi:hypothetical protein